MINQQIINSNLQRSIQTPNRLSPTHINNSNVRFPITLSKPQFEYPLQNSQIQLVSIPQQQLPTQQNFVGNVVYDQKDENDIQFYDNSYNSRVIYSRKVYSCLFIQMLIIDLWIYIVLNTSYLQSILNSNPVGIISFILMMGISLITFIFRKSFRSSPMNYISFISFLISACIFLTYMVSNFNSQIILLILSSITSVVLFLLFYSLTVKQQLTYQGSTLFLCGSILIVFELFTIFTHVSLFWLIVTSLFSFIFAYFLIYVTQTTLSSGEIYDISVEDEISSSIIVYWDIIILILNMADMIKNYIIKNRN